MVSEHRLIIGFSQDAPPVFFSVFFQMNFVVDPVQGGHFQKILNIDIISNAVMRDFFVGLHRVPLKKMERYAHALAGGTIGLCGLAIEFLGL